MTFGLLKGSKTEQAYIVKKQGCFFSPLPEKLTFTWFPHDNGIM